MSVKFKVHTGIKRRKFTKYIVSVVVLALVLCGAYLIVLNVSPRLMSDTYVKSEIDLDLSDDAMDSRNRIQIAKINLEVAIHTGPDASTLEKGVWNRFSERGDPEKGGNFILSAHRFKLGTTPQNTKAKSPFYNVHKLVVGDTMRVFFNKQWYDYTINKIYSVKPDQISIEEPSDVAKITLYTCSLKGSADGRVVLEATLSNM